VTRGWFALRTFSNPQCADTFTRSCANALLIVGTSILPNSDGSPPFGSMRFFACASGCGAKQAFLGCPTNVGLDSFVFAAFFFPKPRRPSPLSQGHAFGNPCLGAISAANRQPIARAVPGAASLPVETAQFGGRSRFFAARAILMENWCPLFLIARLSRHSWLRQRMAA